MKNFKIVGSLWHSVGHTHMCQQ